MTLWEIWKYPALIGVATAVGMGVALGTDGFGDVFSWTALAVPLAVAVGFVIRAYLPASGRRGSAS